MFFCAYKLIMWIPPHPTPECGHVTKYFGFLRLNGFLWVSVPGTPCGGGIPWGARGRRAAPGSPALPPVAVTPRTAPKQQVPGCARGERRRLAHVLPKPESLGEGHRLTGGLGPAWHGVRHARGPGGRPVCLVRVGAEPPRPEHARRGHHDRAELPIEVVVTAA